MAVAYAPVNHSCTSAGHWARTPDELLNTAGEHFPVAVGGTPIARCFVSWAGEDGAEHCDADAAADSPEERRSARRRAEVAVLHRVLYGEDQHLHHHAEPDAEHEHVETRRSDAGVFIHP
jgi:hypothetical protein